MYFYFHNFLARNIFREGLIRGSSRHIGKKAAALLIGFVVPCIRVSLTTIYS